MTVLTKVAAGQAGVFVHCDQARIGCCCENALRAVLLGLGLRRVVIGNAAAGIPETNLRRVQLGIEAPALRARIGVEREQNILTRAEVKAVIYLNRRALKRARHARANLPSLL